jgi:hypothetical protein
MERLGQDKALLSVRIKFKNSGEYSHDFRLKETKNADPSKKHLNKVIISQIDSPSSQNLGFFQRLFKILKSSVKSTYQEKTGKKWRKNSKQYITGVISFSDYANAHKTQDLESLDKSAADFLKSFKEQYNLREDALVYLIRHSDEISQHYHFTVLNQDKDGNTLNKRINRTETAKIQDLAGVSFGEMGIDRGISKVERIQAGDFNVVNQNLDVLRSNLRPELEQKQKQLKSLDLTITERLEQTARLNGNIEKFKKLRKNFTVYLNRSVNVVNDEDKKRKNKILAAKALSKIEKGFGRISIEDLEIKNPTEEVERAVEDIFLELDYLKLNDPKLTPEQKRRIE